MKIVPAGGVDVEVDLTQGASVRSTLAAMAALVALVVRDRLHFLLTCLPLDFISCTPHLVWPLQTSRIRLQADSLVLEVIALFV